MLRPSPRLAPVTSAMGDTRGEEVVSCFICWFLFCDENSNLAVLAAKINADCSPTLFRHGGQLPMDLLELGIFVRVAELGSYTRAAEQLGLAKGRVSSAVQHLESQLGTRLLHRTTRQVRLTADGEQFLERGKELLVDAEQLDAMFLPISAGLRGRVRIDLPNTFARDVIIPRLPELFAAHPQLEISVNTTDQRVDIVRDGFDCVLRIGALQDSGLVARPLGELRQSNVASPAYLRANGVPKSLSDLADHRIIHYAPRLGTHGAGWEYEEAGQARLFAMRSSVVVNGTDAYQAACLAGLGLIQAPVRGTRRLVESGLLVEVLSHLTAPPMPVSLVYANRRHVPPRVQAVLQWMGKVVQEDLTAASVVQPARGRRRTRS
jgi:DNA-binding transcriptional LysR family regulator